jgi:hypothetical protein
MLKMYHSATFFLEFKSNLLVKREFFLSNAAFSMEILHLMLRVHFLSFAIRLAE